MAALWASTISNAHTPTSLHGHLGLTLDLLATHLRSIGRASARAQRSGPGAEQSGALRRGGPQSAVVGALFERDRQALPTAVADFCHQPASQRPAGADHESYDLLRMTEGQPVAARSAGRQNWRPRSTPGRRRTGGHDRPRALQAPRNAPHLLWRHRFADSGWTWSLGKFHTWPTRSSKPRVRSACAKLGRQAQAAPHRPWRHSPRGSSCWAGQAGRRRVELFERHRPDLPVRRDGRGRRTTHAISTPASSSTALAREVVRLLTERTELGIAYRVDLRLRPTATAAQSAISPGTRPALLRRLGPHLGAAGVRQGPAGGRRLDLGQAISRSTRALGLSPLPEPRGHHRHQSPQAAHRAAHASRRGRRLAMSRRATAASATSSSSFSSCNCSTAATCPPCAPATRWRPSPSWRSAVA